MYVFFYLQLMVMFNLLCSISLQSWSLHLIELRDLNEWLMVIFIIIIIIHDGSMGLVALYRYMNG